MHNHQPKQMQRACHDSSVSSASCEGDLVTPRRASAQAMAGRLLICRDWRRKVLCCINRGRLTGPAQGQDGRLLRTEAVGGRAPTARLARRQLGGLQPAVGPLTGFLTLREHPGAACRNCCLIRALGGAGPRMVRQQPAQLLRSLEQCYLFAWQAAAHLLFTRRSQSLPTRPQAWLAGGQFSLGRL